MVKRRFVREQLLMIKSGAIMLLILALGFATTTGQTVTSGPLSDAMKTVEKPATRPSPTMLESFLKSQVSQLLARRRGEVAAATTPEQIAQRQKKLKAFFLQSLGDLPERTPLNPRPSSARGGIRVTELSGSSSTAGRGIESPPCSTCRRESLLSRACWFPADTPPTAKRPSPTSEYASCWPRTESRLFVMIPSARESAFRSWTPAASRPSARDRRPSTRWRGSGRYWSAARLRRTGSGMESGARLPGRPPGNRPGSPGLHGQFGRGNDDRLPDGPR